jgi:hypothetical protein
MNQTQTHNHELHGVHQVSRCGLDEDVKRGWPTRTHPLASKLGRSPARFTGITYAHASDRTLVPIVRTVQHPHLWPDPDLNRRTESIVLDVRSNDDGF